MAMAPWLPLALSARRLVSSLASASSRRRRLPAAALVTGAGRPCATGASSRGMALLDELDVELLSRVLSFLSPAPLLMLRRTCRAMREAASSEQVRGAKSARKR